MLSVVNFGLWMWTVRRGARTATVPLLHATIKNFTSCKGASCGKVCSSARSRKCSLKVCVGGCTTDYMSRSDGARVGSEQQCLVVHHEWYYLLFGDSDVCWDEMWSPSHFDVLYFEVQSSRCVSPSTVCASSTTSSVRLKSSLFHLYRRDLHVGLFTCYMVHTHFETLPQSKVGILQALVSLACGLIPVCIESGEAIDFF